VFLFAPLSIHLSVCFWLNNVWRTVREERLDSPCGTDGPRVEDGRSAAAPRTVRLGHVDGPPGAAQSC
jgi:hypothetical protein